MEINDDNQEISGLFEAPEIESRPGFTVVGIKYHGRNPKNVVRNLWSQLESRTKEVKNKVNADETYGIMGPIDPRTGEFDYMVGYEVKKVGKLPEGLGQWEIPEQTYAVLPCTYSQLADAVDYLYKYWLTENSFERAQGPEFEYYPEDYDSEDGESELLLHVPVQEI